MIEKFNGIFYLIIFLAHFIGIAVYCFQTIVGTKSFMDKFDIDHSAAIIVRFVGALMIGWVIMALYIMFVRSGGVENTWGCFNLVFVQNLMAFLIGIYSIKINKLGHTEKTSIEGIIAPGVLMILSAILIYGLADKIYT